MSENSSHVGGIYADFERELEAFRLAYAGRPREEMVQLCLLALEREEIVAVAYHEDVLGRRLAGLDIPDDARAVIDQALTWAWKDEEMHAIYVRGALLRLAGWRLRAATLVHQAAGAVGGWAASVRQHVRWREAPLSRAAATLLTGAGTLLGRVPRDVRAHLRYASFRDFCRFNVEAERTAWLCWARLAALAEVVPEVSQGLAHEFRRVQEEEERHRQVFALLAESFDDHDRLAAGVSARSLMDRIGAVGEFFLPRAHRSGPTARNPLGSGDPVWVHTGGPGQKREALRRLLEESGLRRRLEERAREGGRPLGAMKVAIKPTFMLGYARRDLSVVTDPELLDELASWLRGLGCADVAVVECANLYDRFYGGRSVREVAAYLGFDSPDYRVVDSAAEQVPHAYFRGMAQYGVGRTWKEADFRISFAKMRSHPIEHVYLSVANVEWVGGRCDQFLFFDRQAHRETAIMMLLDEFPPHYALLDGYDLAADGLVGMMGCARPPSPRRLYASGDALALDVVAARHLGLDDARASVILRAAFHWFGSPARAPEVRGLDEPVAGWRGPYHNEWSTLLSFMASPMSVLGSGRGALFVPEMDEVAFPPLAPEGALLRTGRRLVRRLIGLRLPA
jgi:uncharacterized protein (DUF362 family)